MVSYTGFGSQTWESSLQSWALILSLSSFLFDISTFIHWRFAPKSYFHFTYLSSNVWRTLTIMIITAIVNLTEHVTWPMVGSVQNVNNYFSYNFSVQLTYKYIEIHLEWFYSERWIYHIEITAWFSSLNTVIIFWVVSYVSKTNWNVIH